jgi:hypothetical protein
LKRPSTVSSNWLCPNSNVVFYLSTGVVIRKEDIRMGSIR